MKTLAKDVKKVDKGWGHELWIANSEKYCGKLLHFNKDKKCSWHYHKIKDEVFFVHSGKLLVYYGHTDSIHEAKKVILEPGDSFHVTPGLRHAMIGLEETDMYEFSTQHFEEDSIRVIKGD